MTTSTGGNPTLLRASSLSRAELNSLPTFAYVPSPSSVSARREAARERAASVSSANKERQVREAALLAQQVAALGLGEAGNAMTETLLVAEAGLATARKPLLVAGAVSAPPVVVSSSPSLPLTPPILTVPAVSVSVSNVDAALASATRVLLEEDATPSASPDTLHGGDGTTTPADEIEAEVDNLADLEEDSNASCSICLCDFERGDKLRALPCMHKYHAACVDDWLARSSVCPNCNVDVREAF
jgi:hypothetical protein